MSSKVNVIEGRRIPETTRVAIVVSRTNGVVVDRLAAGAVRALTAEGIGEHAITVIRVPGAFEIPAATRAVLEKKEHDAVITLGAVIRGETPHFDYICRACTDGIARLSVKYDTPLVFGVLTANNMAQAMDRAGEDESNKGAEAALAALEMIGVLHEIGKS